MSEDSEQLKHRDRPGGGWLVVILVALPLLYVLSPPWVALVLGPAYYEKQWFETLYLPLILLSEQFRFVNDFYESYFELVGVT